MINLCPGWEGEKEKGVGEFGETCQEGMPLSKILERGGRRTGLATILPSAGRSVARCALHIHDGQVAVSYEMTGARGSFAATGFG